MKGTRVQSVVQELRGEKIDIVHWIPDQAEYVCRALAPAKVSKIIIDDDDHTMEVITADDQLSLAIGKKGQNVRLASRLTGWRIGVRASPSARFRVSVILPLSCSIRKASSQRKISRIANWEKSKTSKASAKRKPRLCINRQYYMSQRSARRRPRRRRRLRLRPARRPAQR